MILRVASFAFLVASGLVAQSAVESDEEVEVRCELVDRQGRPIAGACAIMSTAEALDTERALAQPLARSDAKGILRFKTKRHVQKTNVTKLKYVFIAHPKFAAVRCNFTTSSYVYTPWGAVQQEAQRFDLGRVTMLPAVTLRGLVRGGDGRPLAGARVEAHELLDSGYYQRLGGSRFGMQPIVSVARTDADGRFVLRGCLVQGMGVHVRATGHYTHFVPYAHHSRPLDLTLEKSGFAKGKVVDGQGKPIRAVLFPAYEALANGRNVRNVHTNDKGEFEMTLEHRGRYELRVAAITPLYSAWRQIYSGSLDGPRDELEFELAAPVDEDPPVTVEVVDKATGKVIADAAAAILWQDPKYTNRMALENAFRSAKKPAKDGKIALPPPRNQQMSTGGVLVKAKGYAPAIVEKVEYDAEKPPKLKVQLERGATLRGVVVDAVTGKPVADAAVDVSLPGMAGQQAQYGYGSSSSDLAQKVRTDAQGRFVVEGLGKDSYELKAGKRGRPDSKELRIATELGKTQDGIRLVLPVGVALHGRLFGGYDAKDNKQPVTLRGGWRVRLAASQQNNYYYNSFMWGGPFGGYYGGYTTGATQQIDPVTVSEDGSFRFTGLGKGRLRLSLIAPPVGLRNAPVTAMIEPLRIRSKDLKRDFDISEDLPGIVRGKLSVKGVQLPLGRLLVASIPIGTAARRTGRVYFNIGYFRCYVEPDGSFAFRATKGRHHLFIMDGASSTVLYHAKKPVDISFGKTSHVEYEIPLTRVRVRLKPETAGGEFVASRLEWTTMFPGDAVNRNFGRYEQGYGTLVQGRREFYIVVPPVKMQFGVNSHLYQVDRQGGHLTSSITTGEVTAVMGELRTLDLRLPPPEDVSNQASEKKKDDAKKKKAEK